MKLLIITNYDCSDRQSRYFLIENDEKLQKVALKLLRDLDANFTAVEPEYQDPLPPELFEQLPESWKQVVRERQRYDEGNKYYHEEKIRQFKAIKEELESPQGKAWELFEMFTMDDTELVEIENENSDC